MPPSATTTEPTPTRSVSEGIVTRSVSEGPESIQQEVPRLRFGFVSDFGALAPRISGWTTNLLATALVLVAGLGMGWQVLAWWQAAPQPGNGALSAAAAATLPLVDGSREFWTAHGPLKIERIRGSEEEAVAAMRGFHRDIEAPSDNPGVDAGVNRRVHAAMGPGEKQFLASLREQTPLEIAGDVTLYQPRGQTAMVVAVSQSQQRIVGWSLALPTDPGFWSLYHFLPAQVDPRPPAPDSHPLR